MTLATATDRSQTLRRKVLVTSATTIAWPTNTEDAVPWDSANTGISLVPSCPALECSVVMLGTDIAVQGYSASYVGEVLDLKQGQYYASVPGNNENFTTTGQASGAYAYPHYSGNLPVGYNAGAMFRNSADLICTNGQRCTVVENNTFFYSAGVVSGQGQSAPVEAFLTVGGSNFAVGFCDAAYVVEPQTIPQLRRSKRRQHLIFAYKSAMAGLKRAEEARASAVEQEARLGIDWDDWEDEPT